MSTTPPSPQARPHVVVHVAITLDGATTGFAAAVGRFYQLAGTWQEDVTLAGADTILAQERALQDAPRRAAPAGAPLLAVVDSAGRVRSWEALRGVGHWSGVIALYSAATSPRPGRAVPELVTGSERVDLAEALAVLHERHGARVVRVDSGGGLTGALLERGLVGEVSLLVHPCTVGPRERVWHGGVALPALELIAGEPLDDGLVWLRYRVPQGA